MKTYSTPTAFRRALEVRLSAAAKSLGMDLQRVRRQVAFDRLLERLFNEPGQPWVLKGGYALELKLKIARTTKDLNLGICSPSLDMEGVLEALQDAAAMDAGDYFEYTIGAATMDLDGPPYGGARYPVGVKMDGWGSPESMPDDSHRLLGRNTLPRKSMPTQRHGVIVPTAG